MTTCMKGLFTPVLITTWSATRFTTTRPTRLPTPTVGVGSRVGLVVVNLVADQVVINTGVKSPFIHVVIQYLVEIGPSSLALGNNHRAFFSYQVGVNFRVIDATIVTAIAFV